MFSKYSVKAGLIAFFVLFSFGATTAYASHSWNTYHWARTANPFVVKVGDNVSPNWDTYLVGASADWSASSVLDMSVVSGGTDAKRCRPTTGRIEACNAKYGTNGWLGIASIWVSGDHITQGITKMNDSYFNTATYNKPEWRRLVMCQEIAHALGLDHQDENFANPNLGTCMDYTNNPNGPPSNEYPNVHDYEQLETIYTHLDFITTLGQAVTRLGNHSDADNASEWGKSIRKDEKGRHSVYERDLGKGEKVFTFVTWAE